MMHIWCNFVVNKYVITSVLATSGDGIQLLRWRTITGIQGCYLCPSKCMGQCSWLPHILSRRTFHARRFVRLLRQQIGYFLGSAVLILGVIHTLINSAQNHLTDITSMLFYLFFCLGIASWWIWRDSLPVAGYR